MKITPEVTVNQSVKSQNYASCRKLATKSVTRERKLQAQRHSCGAFLPFSGLLSSLSVQKSVGSVVCPGKYLSKGPGTRGAKGTVVLLRAGIDKGAQLDWRGHRCKKSGTLADTKGGKSNRAASFIRFRL
jgi:hypothetical protein